MQKILLSRCLSLILHGLIISEGAYCCQKAHPSTDDLVKTISIFKFLDERNYENSSIARWQDHLN